VLTKLLRANNDSGEMSKSKKRSKIGRPLKRGDHAGSHLHIRISLERKKAYARVATADGKFLTDWILDALDYAAMISSR
jgi:hypothetical protein